MKSQWVLLLGIFLASPMALAWSEHHLVTAAALRDLSELNTRVTAPTDFRDLLRALGYASEVEFNEAILINKNYRFAPKLKETPGTPLRAVDVLTMYSDEPDWGMDENLFSDDQYPQLWRPEYTMMGGRTGLPSRAFRHMYWEKLDWLQPIKTLKLPFSKLFSPMGQAPERAAVFVDLSRRAKKAGQDYWSLRFLADALHYLEDCSQPFHTTQVPTKRFMLLPFGHLGNGLHGYVKQMTNVISYYHFSFEDYVAHLMLDADAQGASSVEGQRLNDALAENLSQPRELSYDDEDISKTVIAMAKIAVRKAPEAARASLAFFPKSPMPFMNLPAGDPEVYLTQVETADWWKDVVARGKQDTPAERAYFKVVESVFSPLGFAVWKVVRGELMNN